MACGSLRFHLWKAEPLLRRHSHGRPSACLQMRSCKRQCLPPRASQLPWCSASGPTPPPPRIRLQIAAATPCQQCSGSGFLSCQVCMGERRWGLGGCRHAHDVQCRQHSAPCKPTPLLTPAGCRQGHHWVQGAGAPQAAAAAGAAGGSRRQRRRRTRAGALLLPCVRHDADAALPQLPWRGPRVPARLTAAVRWLLRTGSR